MIDLKTIQLSLKNLFYSLGGSADNVRNTDDVNTIIDQMAALGLGAKIDAGGGLPEVTAEDNGDVLTVVSGEWSKAAPSGGLPEVTSADNGDVLTVVEGEWAKAAPSGGGGALIVTETNGTLDKTWAEINAAAPLAWRYEEGGYYPLGACVSEDGEYFVSFAEISNPVHFLEYTASSESAYPTIIT